MPAPVLRCRNTLLLALALAPLGAAWAQPERSFGVVPQYSPRVSAARWQPLLNHLNGRSDLALRFVTAPSINDFEERCLKGEYDFVYVNPLLYREIARRAGYRALARGQKPLTGVLVVRASAAHTTLTDLNGAAIAFPSPRAFAATLMTRHDLNDGGLRYRPSYLGSHESVYQAVARGHYAAGGGAQSTFEQLPPELRRELRVLHSATPMPAHIIAAHPRVTAAETRRLGQTLLALHTDPAGQTGLRVLDNTRLVRVTDEDLAQLTNLKFPQRPDRLTLHALPRMAPGATRSHFEPLAVYLTQRLQIKVQLKTYDDLPSFEQAVQREQEPALVIANPMQALTWQTQGFTVLAQEQPVGSKAGMRGVLLVRKDSPIQTLRDLAGKRIGFGGGHNAFFASVVPRALLARAGLNGRYTEVSVAGPITAVLAQLRDGAIDAAGSGNQVLANTLVREQLGIEQLRVLAQSEPLPSLAWLAGPALARDLREEIQGELLQFGAEAPGHAAMRAAGIERLTAADAQTYQVVTRYLAPAQHR